MGLLWRVITRWLQLLGLTFFYAAIFGILVTIGDWLFGSYLPTIFSSERNAYLGSLFSEFFGIVMTIVIVDRLNAHRQNRELGEELQVQASSRSNAFAQYAVDRLRAENWLIGAGGYLRRSNLQSANLQGANLASANLAHADLRKTNLRDADLSYANLEHALLDRTDLRGAHLVGAKLPENFMKTSLIDDTTILPNKEHVRPSRTDDTQPKPEPAEPAERADPPRRQHRSDVA